LSVSLLAPRPPKLAQRTIDAEDSYPGTEQDLLTKLIQYFEESELTSQEARWEAERARDYFDGRQYTAEELAILRRRHQPPIVNNYVKRKIMLLLGMERRGRSDPKAFPRTDHEENRADVATQVLRYIADDQRFDVVRSSVYENIMIEGYGGAEVIVEPNEVDGGYNVVVNHIPWNRLFYDPHSQHPGFSDSKYHGFVLWQDRADALDSYPDGGDVLDATMSDARYETYDDKPRTTWSDIARRRVRIVQIHWKIKQDWWIATFTKGGFLEAPMKSPYLDRHGHAMSSLIMRSAFTDRDLNRYGMVKDMISPQDSVNKRESKLIHSLAVNRVIMTQGAVENEDLARNEAAKPDGLIVVAPGDHTRFEIQKDEAEVEGQFKMLQYAVEQMNVTGPNAAMAGKDPREQSGRAIIAQQSGGQMENEPLADALRQWSHKIYEAMWMRARQFWTEQKSIRVTDDNRDIQFIKLNRPVSLQEELQGMPPEQVQQVAAQMQLRPGDPRLQQTVRIEHALDDLDVDITVEEGPDVPTMQAEQFQALIQLPVQILQQFPPSVILKASSLRNKDDLLKELEQHQAAQAQNQQGAQAMQAAQIAKVQADAKDRNAQAIERMHGIASDHAGMPAQNALLDAQTAGARANTLGTMHQMAMDHAAAQQPETGDTPVQPQQPDPMAVQQQQHQQTMDQATLALQAQQQQHDQEMDIAAHALAVKQANKPAPARAK
jgi:hypothetical protein